MLSVFFFPIDESVKIEKFNTMFGWVDLREDGKKRVENKRENEWEGYLDERGRGREK